MGILAIRLGLLFRPPLLCLYLDFHMISIDPHIFRNHFCNIRLDQFHHLRRTVHPVRYQQDFQTVLCHLAGAFPAKKMFHIHPVPFLCFPKNTCYFCPKRYSFFEIQERNFFSQHTIHHIAVSLTRRCIASD